MAIKDKFGKFFHVRRNASNKVNVGCGPKSREGWINVDIQDFANVDVVMDVTKEWDFAGLDFVYAEHFLEHLEIEDGIRFLVNAGQSLKNGGRIRISTPNIEWVLKTHYRVTDESSDETKLHDVSRINRAFYGWGHRFLYSEWLLTKILTEIGYSCIDFKEYGVSDIAEFDSIEEHGGYSVFDDSPSVIIVEAQMTKNRARIPQALLEDLEENFIRYSRAKG